ncbi:MAG: ferredoxin [Candidatus Absconditabacterales bacterium]
MGKVDKDICIGCATCVAVAGDLFKMGSDSKAECYKQPETPEEKDLFENAKNNCPVGAISE